jgi:hypothetical protein
MAMEVIAFPKSYHSLEMCLAEKMNSHLYELKAWGVGRHNVKKEGLPFHVISLHHWISEKLHQESP